MLLGQPASVGHRPGGPHARPQGRSQVEYQLELILAAQPPPSGDDDLRLAQIHPGLNRFHDLQQLPPKHVIGHDGLAVLDSGLGFQILLGGGKSPLL